MLHTRRILVDRLIPAAALVALLAAAAGCGGTRDASAPAPKAATLPDTASVTCDADGAKVLTPRVRPQRDGVHIRVENLAGRPLDSSVMSTSGDGGGGLALPDTGSGLDVMALTPGTWTIRCSDPATGADPSEAKGVPLEVVDELALWTPTFAAATCNESVSTFMDFAQGAAGEQGDPAALARSYFKGRGVLKAGDVVEPAGYPDQADKEIRLAREGKPVASVHYMGDRSKGWLLDKLTACQGIGLGLSTLAALTAIVGADGVLTDPPPEYLVDQTESRNLRGHAEAVVRPGSTEETAAVVAWCYEHDVPITPRGGGTGYAGGCVPVEGGIVLSLDRLDRVRSFDPLLWRMEVEAGVTTAEVRRRARESGLYFPPDPGAAENSHIGGNIATNAGGPHAFKYGVTGAWVTGLEAVVAPGEVVRVGGPLRKDVAGYDLKSLLIGSEGTLGIVTAAWLRLIPAPEAALPVVGLFASPAEGCAAIEEVVGSGLRPATLEYLDEGTLRAAPPPFAAEAGFAVIAEADGSAAEAAALRDELRELFAATALAVHAPEGAAVAELWRWREGVTFGVTAKRGGKVSEDIVVPLDRLREAIEETLAIGRRVGVEACSWGHAGDGNLHSSFLVDRGDEAQLAAAREGAEELFALAARLGGSISGEHGMGVVKSGQLGRIWAPAALELHRGIKRLFDPKNLLNPGKKLA